MRVVIGRGNRSINGFGDLRLLEHVFHVQPYPSEFTFFMVYVLKHRRVGEFRWVRFFIQHFRSPGLIYWAIEV